MKKCIAVILALIFALSTVSVAALAEESGVVASQNVSTNQTVELKNDDYLYSKYLSAHQGFTDSQTDYIMAGDSYTAIDGAIVEKVDSYTDENGVTKEGVLKWTGEDGTLSYTFNIEKDGLYEISLIYCPIKGRGLPLSFAFKVDGELPYSALKAVNFARTWINEDIEGVKDSSGNIYSSEQIEKLLFREGKVMETSGQSVAPLKVALTAGTHTIDITVNSGELYLAAVVLGAPAVVKSYSEVKQEYAEKGYQNYSGSEIHLEGEKAIYKTASSMNPLIDNSDPSITPSEAFKSIINYIGGTGWQKPNEAITWEFEAPEDGLYKIAFRFRQNTVINGNSYRSLKIDGVSPFEEASKISFYYDGGWQFTEMTADDEPALVYLTKGKHQLSLEVTLADLGDVSSRINDVTYELGNLYLKIRMITGDKIDTGRSYEFFKNIPGFEEKLEECIKALQEVRKKLVEITKQSTGTYIATIDNMIRIAQLMHDNRYTAQNYVGTFYDSYCSLCALVTDVAKLPLDLDQIIIAAPEKEYDFIMASFWEKTKYGFQRFLVSFMDNYRYKTQDVNGKTTLTLWLTWGVDKAQVLRSLVKDTFEAENPDINVNVQIVGATLIQAILSGSGPDVLIGQVRTEPVNYGMRGALYDLSQFEDFEQVLERYQKGAENPYRLGNAVYGLPDTQDFSIMFYRTDIFEEMGLGVPQTWDDFKQTASLLQRQNLEVGYPGAGLYSWYATNLVQNGISPYSDDHRSTNFTSGNAINVFVDWCDYHVNLGFPVAYDFYNRFRSGTMPMGVAAYTTYTTFSQAAPEIVGKWGVAKVPGVRQEDGTVNHAVVDSGTASVIPNISKHKEEAWKFLKWWTSENTQYRYSTMVEAVLGDTGRHPTANVEAFKKLPWESDDLEIMLDAWSEVNPIAEIPGGYYLDRTVYQAFWNVVNLSENPKDMIVEWGNVADQEIQRKRDEYNLD